MPLSVTVDPAENLIFAEGEGIVTDDDLAEYVQEYLDRRGLRELDELFDLTRADLDDLTYKGLARVAQAAAATDQNELPTKIAILVDEVTGRGLSRMYQILRDDQGGSRAVRLFGDRSDCLEWLGLPAGWAPPTAESPSRSS